MSKKDTGSFVYFVWSANYDADREENGMRMEKCRWRTPLIAASICGFLLAEAHAAEPKHQGVYVGIRAGESTLYNSRHQDDHGKIISNTWTREWTDTSSHSLSTEVGYWFVPYFAIEVSYWDFGEGTFNEQRVSGGVVTNAITRDRYLAVTTTAKGYAGGVVASYPWRNWRVSAKLAALKNEIRNSGTGNRTTTLLVPPNLPPTSSPIVLEETQKSTSPIYGASVSYTFADHFVVEADWRTVKRMGEQAYFGGLSAKVIGLGLQYRF